MKKILTILLLSGVTTYTFAIDAEIVSNIPAQVQEQGTRADGLRSLSSVMSSLSNSKTTPQQINALQNLQALQSNPNASVSDVNNAVTGLLQNFNGLNNTTFSNLSQLISQIAGSSTSAGMNLKLQEASQQQFMAIQNTLQTISAQNQAQIAFKQAQINEENKTQQQMQNQHDAENNVINQF